MNRPVASRNRRKNYFIKKGFQTNFILKFCLLVIFACAVMGAAVYFLTEKTTTTSFENLRLTVKTTADFILPALVSSSLIAIILVSLATVIVVLFISHRIAGPLYKLERSLDEIGKGNLTSEVQLRKADEIKALAASINHMIRNLREPLRFSQAKISELEEDAVSAKESLKTKGVPENEAERLVSPIQKKIQQLKHSLSYFKLSCFAFFLFSVFLISAAYASVSDEKVSRADEWSITESIFCAIYFRYDVNINAVNNKIDTYKVDYGLSVKPPRRGESAENEIAYKLDLIFLKVQEILDMRPKDLHAKVKIYRLQEDLDRVYMEMLDQKNKFIAFYIFDVNTLFSSEQKISANVIAHEIAHCVVDHYFSVIPPPRVAEMIAQYADVHLRD